MERKIVSNGGFVEFSDANTPLVSSDELDDIEEYIDEDEVVSSCASEDPQMLQRLDDIDQATSEYVVNLMGFGEYGISFDDLGYNLTDLRQIEDAFEDVLYQVFGITIYRPRVVQDAYGVETIVGSIYSDE